MSAVDYRRALHRIPELDNQLPETVQLVQRILAPLPCRVFSPITGSVCAWFDAGKSDAVAFRAELDALPVTEATDLPYASGGVEQEVEAAALAESLNRFLESLPQEKRVLFVRRYWYLCSVEELAAWSGRRRGTVSAALFRLRQDLQEHLEREGFTL